MKYCDQGCYRQVLLVRRWALKFPRVNDGWYRFLEGLLSNMHEVENWKDRDIEEDAKMCPILWWLPGGFLVVQRRAQPVPTRWWTWRQEAQRWFQGRGWRDSMNNNNYGVLDGRVVRFDLEG